MDHLITFYTWVGFPINHQAENRHKWLAWCIFTLIWYTYHYAHVWLIKNLLILLYPKNLSSFVLGFLYITLDAGWVITVKTGLLVASYSQYKHCNHGSLFHTINKLNLAFYQINSSKTKILMKWFVCAVLTVNMIISVIIAYLFATFIYDCYTSRNKCPIRILWITPWLDYAGEFLDTMSFMMAASLIPLLASLSCLQFAVTLDSLRQKLITVPHFTLDAKVTNQSLKLFEYQAKIMRQLSSAILVLVSLLILYIVSMVTQLAMRDMIAGFVFSLYVITISGYILLLCFASSRAETAKRNLLYHLRLHRTRCASHCKLMFDALIQGVERYNVQVCAANFYTLNRSFILTLIGTCCTFAIILYQNQ